MLEGNGEGQLLARAWILEPVFASGMGEDLGADDLVALFEGTGIEICWIGLLIQRRGLDEVMVFGKALFVTLLELLTWGRS